MSATQHGRAGRSTYRAAVSTAVLALVSLLGILLLLGSIGQAGGASFLLVLLAGGAAYAFLDPLIHKSNRTERGADAEVDVAGILRGLPDGYHVLHDLTFDGFNVDHVVVGPTRVFVIETKSYRGEVGADGERLLLNGRPLQKNALSQAWKEAYAVRNLIKAGTGKARPVRPLLCFPRAFIKARRPVKGVLLVGRRFLLQALTRPMGRSLSASEIQEVVGVLKSKVSGSAA